MRSAILVDTGAIYALADQDDTWHEPVKFFLEGSAHSLIVPVTVLPEVCYLINTYLGQQAERRFVAAPANGELTRPYCFRTFPDVCGFWKSMKTLT